VGNEVCCRDWFLGWCFCGVSLVCSNLLFQSRLDLPQIKCSYKQASDCSSNTKDRARSIKIVSQKPYPALSPKTISSNLGTEYSNVRKGKQHLSSWVVPLRGQWDHEQAYQELALQNQASLERRGLKLV
uniref:Uncharacterized protein n=1 Tax=Chrysemys picta bellii TaxID=8478 RepID=A0A8C3PCI8_CHRPI